MQLLCRSDIPHRRRHDLENIIDSSTTGLEIIIIEATLRRKERWIYIVGYKPPGVKYTAFYDVFSTMYDLILQESQNIVILGDYNRDFMADNPMKDICETFDLQNLVNDPTCLKNRKGSLIDLCLVSNPSRFKKALNFKNAGLVTGKILFVLPQSSSFLTKNPVWSCTVLSKILLMITSYVIYIICWNRSTLIRAMVSTHVFKHSQIVWMISWIFTNLWKRKPLGRIMYPIWIVKGGKWCTKGIWCVILRTNILVLKIANGTAWWRHQMKTFSA